MTINLAALPSTAPLPTGINVRKYGSGSASLAWPGPQNYIRAGAGDDGQIGPFQRTQRFALRAGATIITHTSTPGWNRFDYILRLTVGESYVNDLNGINFFQKANSIENHTDPWQGVSIEGAWLCEANTTYHIRLLSNSSTNGSYYQAVDHYNLWGYTIGEGVY